MAGFLLEHPWKNSIYEESLVNTEVLNDSNRNDQEKNLLKVSRNITSVDSECVSTVTVKADREMEEDTKSESNLFLQLETLDTIKNVALDHCYCSTVFSQRDYKSPTSFLTQNEFQLKSEPLNDLGTLEVIVYEDWRIKIEEPVIKEDDLEQKETRCGKLCPDETESLIQIVKSESEEMYDVKDEDLAITIIKEEVESDNSSFSPDFVGQDCQVKCENYIQEGNDLILVQTSPRSNLLELLPKSDHCSSKTVQETTSNVDIQNKFAEKKNANFLKCDLCSYKTNRRSRLRKHSLQHKNPEELNMYKCNKCHYQTVYKESLKCHLLTHNSEEIIMFKCSKCDFQTIYKKYIKIHLLRHSSPEDVQVFKCNKCNFRSKYKYSLRTHQLTHVKKFKCDQCSYKTNYQSRLNRHSRQHTNPEELDTIKCDKCDFQTVTESYLKPHLLQHRIPDELDMFKCNKCDYQAKLKNSVISHQFTHNNCKDVKTFKCHQCSYSTNYRSDLNEHCLLHRHPEVDIFKCYKCDYQTKLKNSLIIHHRLRHNNSQEFKNTINNTFKLLMTRKGST